MLLFVFLSVHQICKTRFSAFCTLNSKLLDQKKTCSVPNSISSTNLIRANAIGKDIGYWLQLLGHCGNWNFLFIFCVSTNYKLQTTNTHINQNANANFKMVLRLSVALKIHWNMFCGLCFLVPFFSFRSFIIFNNNSNSNKILELNSFV